MNPLPVAIIGGGPAGMAAAMQLHRMGVEAALFERAALGGLMIQANWIENYPGFPSGITGADLALRFRDGLAHCAFEVRKEDVQSLDFDNEQDVFSIRSSGGCFSSERVIVASGTKPKRLPLFDGLPQELRLRIFDDVTKIPVEENGRIIILGAGDIALDYALSLSATLGREVVVLCRGDRSRALTILQDKARRNPSISLRFQSEPDRVDLGPQGKIRLSGKRGEEPFSLDADFVLVSVGREPGKDFYSSRLQTLEKELIASDRLFLAGDVKNGLRRQIGIAVGDGLTAAMAAAEARAPRVSR